LGAARGGSAVEAGVAVWEREEREVAHRDRERRRGFFLCLSFKGYIIPLFLVLRHLASKQSKLILQETKERVLIDLDCFHNK
jgi:hypothetical protein